VESPGCAGRSAVDITLTGDRLPSPAVRHRGVVCGCRLPEATSITGWQDRQWNRPDRLPFHRAVPEMLVEARPKRHERGHHIPAFAGAAENGCHDSRRNAFTVHTSPAVRLNGPDPSHPLAGDFSAASAQIERQMGRRADDGTGVFEQNHVAVSKSVVARSHDKARPIRRQIAVTPHPHVRDRLNRFPPGPAKFHAHVSKITPDA